MGRSSVQQGVVEATEQAALGVGNRSGTRSEFAARGNARAVLVEKVRRRKSGGIAAHNRLRVTGAMRPIALICIKPDEQERCDPSKSLGA